MDFEDYCKDCIMNDYCSKQEIDECLREVEENNYIFDLEVDEEYLINNDDVPFL